MSSTQKRPIVAPIYAAAATWLLYALLFPLYRPAQYACAAAASVIVFLIALLLCRSGAKKAAANAAQAGSAAKSAGAEKAAPAQSKEADESAQALAELQRLQKSIQNERLRADIAHLQATAGKIFTYVKDHPEKQGSARKFTSYYLPTTLKLLQSYERMEKQGVDGENITASMERIGSMMHTTITAAFDKQLDALFGDEALDISTDITVLETMMAREGLTDKQQSAAEDNIQLQL